MSAPRTTRIAGFPKYRISRDGRVYFGKLRNLKLLKPQLTVKGYLIVGLYNENGRKPFTVHRVVALTFIANPDNSPIINHKDGIKTNNAVQNLEWVTYTENLHHAMRTGLNDLRKTVQGRHVHTGEVVTYPSTVEAAKAVGKCSSAISAAARGQNYTAAGYRWRYI